MAEGLRPAGALPAVVSSPAALPAVAATLPVRCLRGSRRAGALPRLALGVVSEGPRPGGWRARWVGHSGCGPRRTQGSAFVRGTPRLLRLLRDPVTNAEASGLKRAKEESWVPLGVGWAALLPSRGTVHEKGEALPRLTPPAVDLPPVGPSEGGRSTDGTRQRGTLARERRNEESCVQRRAQARPRDPEPPPGPLPVEALSETRPSASRGSAPARSRPPQAAHQQGQDLRISQPRPTHESAERRPRPDRPSVDGCSPLLSTVPRRPCRSWGARLWVCGGGSRSRCSLR